MTIIIIMLFLLIVVFVYGAYAIWTAPLMDDYEEDYVENIINYDDIEELNAEERNGNDRM